MNMKNSKNKNTIHQNLLYDWQEKRNDQNRKLKNVPVKNNNKLFYNINVYIYVGEIDEGR